MRRQVALLVAATTSLVLIAFLVPLGLLLRTLAVDRATAQGVQEAQGLAAVVALVRDPTQLDPVVELADQRSERDVSVVLPDGRVIGAPLVGASRLLALAASGRSFTADVEGGREVYVPVDTERGRAVVRSFVPGELLHRGVERAVGLLVGLGLVLLLVGILVADRLARGTVRPVTALARAAHDLAEGDLSARVEPGGPAEVREVGAAVNQLGQRIGELLAAERESVADLSHRLRTPLTALRLDAGGLQDRDEADRITAGVESLERTVDEVIRSARRPMREGVRAECDAVAVVRDRVAFWQVLAEDQDRQLQVDLSPGPLLVRLVAEDLAAAVDALLGNVFAHTPEGSSIDVGVAFLYDGVVVEVADRGPGLPPAATERGHSGAGSTGLGMDIARRTAEAAGGRLVLADRPAGGARVALVLPLAS
ncbi:MAG: HAMP domain-containing histidine kinase [Frankiaceae bacterium]|nr:HAMP domain-containing histidine kinase [Frankiaceae bacterium]